MLTFQFFNMKYSIAFLFFIWSVSSKAQDISGVYLLHTNSEKFELKRTLTLHQDGTFSFHNYKRDENGIPKETNTYGKGHWKIDKKVVSFSSSSLDGTFTLDFNETKARYISKSPRDTSDRVIKTALRFYQSNLFWVKGMTLEKQ